MKIIIKETDENVVSVSDSQSFEGPVVIQIDGANGSTEFATLSKDEIKDLFFAIGSCYELATGEKLKKQ